MNSFTKIFSATEDFMITVPLPQISRNMDRIRLCSGLSAQYVFGEWP